MRARHDAQLPPFISIVQRPSRPVMLGTDSWPGKTKSRDVKRCFPSRGDASFEVEKAHVAAQTKGPENRNDVKLPPPPPWAREIGTICPFGVFSPV